MNETSMIRNTAAIESMLTTWKSWLCYGYKILGRGSFADEHCLVIVLRRYVVQLSHLIVYLIGSDLVLRADKYKLVLIALEDFLD